MYELSFVIAALPELPNRRRQGSWQATWKHAKQWKLWVECRCQDKKPAEPLEQAAIHLTRYSSVEPDPDNLAASFKPVIDGLTQSGIIVNDRSANVALQFSWKKVLPSMGAIRVEVKEIEA